MGLSGRGAGHRCARDSYAWVFWLAFAVVCLFVMLMQIRRGGHDGPTRVGPRGHRVPWAPLIVIATVTYVAVAVQPVRTLISGGDGPAVGALFVLVVATVAWAVIVVRLWQMRIR